MLWLAVVDHRAVELIRLPFFLPLLFDGFGIVGNFSRFSCFILFCFRHSFLVVISFDRPWSIVYKQKTLHPLRDEEFSPRYHPDYVEHPMCNVSHSL